MTIKGFFNNKNKNDNKSYKHSKIVNGSLN